MSLPPGFLDELRTRISLSQVVGRKVTWDVRKSNLGKGDMWAPCPFHQEKSASFHVDDRKGFYYCFGCHAKGDALTFLKESENLSFMEAVELLAREAGMPMPARDPQATQKADRRTQLSTVMEEAVKWFRLQLRTSAAADARAYLARRGLADDAQDRWEIGFAPDQRQSLLAALTAKGIAPDLIVDAGLCARADDGSTYDRFRGRIIFPIRDGRGRAISLGGRSLDPNARAKYLNGPETELFDKGRNLYNQARAREASGKGAALIVAEGYMDVIALSEAGFCATVAPLGTAITEDQLRLMWRISDEPVIALDGDTAGIRAALRVIDLALPLLESGKGLRFAVLPTGLDPDDLIKAQGAGAMRAVLEAAQPMVRLLWNRETEGRNFDSPERKAALDKTLRAALQRITDPSIRSHYAEEIKSLRWELFNANRKRPAAPTGTRPGTRAPFKPEALPASARTRQSQLAQGGSGGEALIEAAVLATFVTHPTLVARFAAALERLDLTGDDHNALRYLLLAHWNKPDLADQILAAAPAALDRLMSEPHVRTILAMPTRATPETAALCLAGDLAKLETERGARKETEVAVEDLEMLSDLEPIWRLAQATSARDSAMKPDLTEGSDVDDDRALSKHLQNLIDGQVWIKKNH